MSGVSNDELIEYSMLANKCYSPNDDNCCLPTNWTALYYYDGKNTDGNVYGLFINKYKKEIKGTDNWINMLSNAKIVLGGRPIGQNEAERRAREALERCEPHQREAIKAFINSIQRIDEELSPELLKINFIDLYVMLEQLGILGTVLSNLLKSLRDLLLPGQSFNISDLMITRGKIRNDLITSLNDNTLRSVVEFNNAKQKLVKNFEEYKLKIVGHSLGAVMAELCAFEIGVECIGIESPGAKEIIQNISPSKNKTNYVIMTYMSAPNIINTLHSHFENSYRMFLPHTEEGVSFLHVANCMFHGGSRVLTYASLGTFTLGKALFQEVALDTVAVTAGVAVATKLAGGVFGLWNDINWLLRQHSLPNIIAYLEEKEHVQIKPIIEWPKLTRTGVVDATVNLLRGCFIPFQKDLPGLRNILDEEGMREANIENMTGYKVV